MVEIIGVRFKEVGKIYYFDPDGLKVKQGDRVIVETARGIECSEVMLPNREIDEAKVVSPLRKAIRIATQEDLDALEANKTKEKEAFALCEKKIAQHKLDMKLIDVEYTFDGSKILFYFTADGRVDFRELVKDLAGVFRMRIELRQIGVRDEAKMYGGLGMCGRPLCCASFLDDFQPVSIKMAKEQGLSLNPTKISGTCGRLMCCLKYEQDAYEDLIHTTPKVDTQVRTPDGVGTIIEVNLLRGLCKVKLDDSGDTPKFYHKDLLQPVHGGKSCGHACETCDKETITSDPPVPQNETLAAWSEPEAVEQPAEASPEAVSVLKAAPPAELTEEKPAAEEAPRKNPRNRPPRDRKPRNDEAHRGEPSNRGEQAHRGEQTHRGEQAHHTDSPRPQRQDRKPAAEKDEKGEKPHAEKSGKSGAEKTEKAPHADRPRNDRPRQDRPHPEKPAAEKQERPADKVNAPANKPASDKPKSDEEKTRPRHRGHRGRGGRGGQRPHPNGDAPNKPDAPKTNA